MNENQCMMDSFSSNRFLVKFIYSTLKSFFFILTAGTRTNNSCAFTADIVGMAKKENYLDPMNGINVGSRDEILQRIRDNTFCGPYNLLTANCEHLATYIRYNVSSVRQVSGKLHIIPI